MSEFSRSIAICGIGCRFAGGVNDVKSLWELLMSRQDAISEVPSNRWNAKAFYHKDPSHMGLTNSKWGGFVDGIDQFDPAFFGISEREAGYIDPQQRMLLEAVWESIEDGGYDLAKIRSLSPGVFVGIATIDYATQHVSPVGDGCGSPYAVTGTSHSIAANRISYSFDFDGPSYAIDTACSSSLIAVHLACESLLRGECRMAFAGGVNSLLLPSTFIGLSNMSALAPDGRCKAFDARANGFARGEGVGMVALRPLEDALADGDHVYGVILATGTNQDGATRGLAHPNEDAQVAVVQETIRRAGIQPDEIRYVEAHGTGTSVGDVVETASLGRSIGKGRNPEEACIIGSIKTNIGHLEAGAGIAGLIKCALILDKGVIPANLHFKNPNPKIDFAKLGLRVASDSEALPGIDDGTGPVLGVNSFGFGGSNSFALLGRPPEAAAKVSVAGNSRPTPEAEQMLVLSARTADALRARASQFSDLLLEEGEGNRLAAICRSAAFRQTHHNRRLAVHGTESKEIAAQLAKFAEEGSGGIVGEVQAESRPVFVFSGQGAQWFAMGRKLYEEEPVFRKTLEECDEALQAEGASWSLLEELLCDEADSRLANTEFAQPAIFAVQVAQAALWESWGVRPAAVVGHSVGEVAAAYVAGALTLSQAVRVIYHRGRCMSHAPGDGGMLAAGLTEDEALEMIAPYGDALSLASLNGPLSVAISGEKEALREIDRELEKRGRFHKFVPVEYAFHSAQMDPAREELLESLEGLTPIEASLPIVSTVSGKMATGTLFDAEYWWENVRRTVRFAPAIEALADLGYRLFVENAAHPVLRASVQQCLEEYTESDEGVVIPTMRKNENDREAMLDALGQLHCVGYPVDWNAFFQESDRLFQVALPKYPWQKKRYWEEVPLWERSRLRPADFRLEGWKIEDPKFTRHIKLDRGVLSYFNDHRVGGRVVLPAAAYVEMAAVAGRQLFEGDACRLEDLNLLEPVVFDDTGSDPLIQIQYDATEHTISIHGGSEEEGDWRLQGTGKLEPFVSPAIPETVDLESIRERCRSREFDAGKLYSSLREWGLDYGKLFQGVMSVRGGEGEALGRVRLPRRLRADSDRYLIHPVLIDSAFHVTSAVFPVDRTQIENPVFMPVSIQKVTWLGRLPDEIWVHVTAVSASLETLIFDLKLMDLDGNVVLEIKGFRCEGLPSGSGLQSGIKPLLYETVWEERALPSGHRGRVAGKALSERFPDLSGLPERLHAEVSAEHAETGFPERAEKTREILSRLWSRYEAKAHPEKGGTCGKEDLASLMREAFDSGPGFHVETLLLSLIGEKLSQIESGEIDSVGLIASGPGKDLFDRWISDAIAARTSRLYLQKAIVSLSAVLPGTRPLRILEVNGADSGIFESVLPSLRGHRCDYWISDTRAGDLAGVEAKFSRFDFLTTVEADLTAEGEIAIEAPDGFDLVLIGSQQYRDAEFSSLLQNIKGLMRSGGYLFACKKGVTEDYEKVLSTIAGETTGAEVDLPEQLQSSGFVDVEFLCGIHSGRSSWEDSLLLARLSPSIPENRSEENSGEGLSDAAGRWLLLDDTSELVSTVADQIESRGGKVTSISIPLLRDGDLSGSAPGDAVDLKTLEEEVRGFLSSGEACRGVVHFGALDSPANAGPALDQLIQFQEKACHALFPVLKSLADHESETELPGLTVVTCQAQPGLPFDGGAVSIASAPVLGFSRVIATEMPSVRCRRIDLSFVPGEIEISAFIDELVAELVEKDQDEDEIALRGESRYVPRVVPAAIANKALENSAADSYRVEIGAAGSLDGIVFRPLKRRKPESGEVEIKVSAAGVNFRDVMKVLGMYPRDAPDALDLGDECTGRVVRVGEGVSDFKVGDRVVASASACFASHVTISERLVLPLPVTFSFEEGATFLVNYTTAYFALNMVGGMQEGERVLIHAGAGGVGMAAVRIALAAGAEVFATAGNHVKRKLLHDLGVHHVYDSRSLLFAEELMEDTAGEGVDLILNSLAGDMLKKSLELLGENGRFLEIGKRDIFGDTRISLKPFRKSTSFHAIDLSQVMRGKRRDSILEGIRKELENGVIRPLPFRTFPIGETAEAFRCVAQARHIGKVVLTTDGSIPETTPPVNRDRLYLRPDASYLITGGLRGLGLSMAEWCASKGARYLILTNRSGVCELETEEGIKRLEERGVEVMVRASDVSDPDALNELLKQASDTMPPIKGVFHGAAALSDRVLLQMTPGEFETAMRPKAYGAWNLHCQMKEMPLDFFLMMSSISAINGTPGQGNYAAANAFEDALSHYRRKMNLPALSVNWDMVREVGMAARDPEMRQHFERIKWEGISPEQVQSCVERLLMNAADQVCVTTLNWRNFLQQPGLAPQSPRFERLRGGDSDDDSLSGEGSIRIALASAPPDRRRPLIEEFLQLQIAEMTRHAADGIETNVHLETLGIDSLMGVELLVRIERKLGVAVRSSQLMKMPTISGIAEVISDQIASDAAEDERADQGMDEGHEAASDGSAAGDLELVDSIPLDFEGSDQVRGEDIKTVFLTGATGFLGAQLVEQLLKQTRAEIRCLVRGGTNRESLDRLVGKLKDHGIALTVGELSRIVAVPGDLGTAGFGLSESSFEELASDVDLIFHAGAEVNHVLPYEHLRATNVLGTVEVLRLAALGGGVPVHLMSSVAVFGLAFADQDRVFSERDLPIRGEIPDNGYIETKRVAEELLWRIGERGLPVSAYRLGLLIGSGGSGGVNEDDFLWRVLKASVLCGQAPDISGNLYLAPVDCSAEAVVWIATQMPGGSCYHLVGGEMVRFNDLIDATVAFGVPIRRVSVGKWLEELEQFEWPEGGNPMGPYLATYPADWISAFFSQMATFSSAKTMSILEPSGIEWPPFDISYLSSYFASVLDGKVAFSPRFSHGMSPMQPE